MTAGSTAHARLRALVVEDSATQALLLRQRLARSGFEVQIAAHGVEALALIEQRPPAVVLTDLDMPEMDGLELVKQLRRRGTAVPVILMTAKGSEEVAVQALRAGASGYVPKRNLDRDLARTMEQVLAMSRTSRERQHVGPVLQRAAVRYELPNYSSLIAPLVRRLQRSLEWMQLCAEADLVRVGMALREALMNAIEHGNLEMSSQLREEDEEQYHRLIAQRREQEPYRRRRVRISAAESRDAVTYVVADDGRGFDPTQCGDPTDPSNLERVYGRGLLLIRSFMDEVTFNAAGNEITMVKRRQA